MLVRNRTVSPRGWPNQVLAACHCASTSTRAPHLGPAPQFAVLVADAWLAVSALRKVGPSRSTRSQTCARRKAGRGRQAGADHRPDHHAEAKPARLGRHRQPLGQAAALVELDVDDVEAARRPGKSASDKQAFVAGDRDRGEQPVELGLAPARQRLLEQRHASRARARRSAVRVGRARKPWLPSTPSQTSGPRGADGARPALDVEIQFAGQLDLDRPWRRDRTCALRPSPRGSSAPTVKVVTTGWARSSPASSHTGWPARAPPVPTTRNRPRSARRRAAASERRAPATCPPRSIRAPPRAARRCTRTSSPR